MNTQIYTAIGLEFGTGNTEKEPHQVTEKNTTDTRKVHGDALLFLNGLHFD